ncbi:hypothetical protein LXL04_032414 [Taraxacum kok-saghyz]
MQIWRKKRLRLKYQHTLPFFEIYQSGCRTNPTRQRIYCCYYYLVLFVCGDGGGSRESVLGKIEEKALDLDFSYWFLKVIEPKSKLYRKHVQISKMMMMEEEKTCTNSVVHSNGSHLEPRLEPTKHLLELGDQTPRNPS